jgi:DNA-binding response OmpR family regulator
MLRLLERLTTALRFLKREAEYTDAATPDLVFLDLNLPALSGIEVLREIRVIPCFRHMPVLILSSSYSPDDITTAYKLGANCFMRRPRNLEELIYFLRTCYLFWSKVAALPPSLPTVLSGGETW